MLHIEAYLPKQLHLGTMIYKAVGHPHTTQLHTLVIMVRHKLSHGRTQPPHNGSVLHGKHLGISLEDLMQQVLVEGLYKAYIVMPRIHPGFGQLRTHPGYFGPKGTNRSEERRVGNDRSNCFVWCN